MHQKTCTHHYEAQRFRADMIGIIEFGFSNPRPMQTDAIEQIMATVTRLLPKTPQDVRRNLHAAFADILNRLDLVTREELEVQETVLRRTRERLKQMEQRVVALEQERTKSK
jgi:BMFP domain-containing protein YqiC